MKLIVLIFSSSSFTFVIIVNEYIPSCGMFPSSQRHCLMLGNLTEKRLICCVVTVYESCSHGCEVKTLIMIKAHIYIVSDHLCTSLTCRGNWCAKQYGRSSPLVFSIFF
jgi:hypothetical protein